MCLIQLLGTHTGLKFELNRAAVPATWTDLPCVPAGTSAIREKTGIGFGDAIQKGLRRQQWGTGGTRCARGSLHHDGCLKGCH